jgi:hypothetical protein
MDKSTFNALDVEEEWLQALRSSGCICPHCTDVSAERLQLVYILNNYNTSVSKRLFDLRPIPEPEYISDYDYDYSDMPPLEW